MKGANRVERVSAIWSEVLNPVEARRVADVKRYDPAVVGGLLLALTGISSAIVRAGDVVSLIIAGSLAVIGVVVAVVAARPRLRLESEFQKRVSAHRELPTKRRLPLTNLTAYEIWLAANGLSAADVELMLGARTDRD